jgi:hypothetical protein
MVKTYRILVTRPEWKRPLGKRRRRWTNNTKVGPKENYVSGLDLSGPGQDPMAGSCEHGNVNSGSIKGREFLDQVNDCQILKKESVLWS